MDEDSRMRKVSSASSSGVSSPGTSSKDFKPTLSTPEESGSALESLESPGQRRARVRSLYIVHAGMFIFMLGYSIILTGVFPYMKQLLPTLVAENPGDDGPLLTRFGWVVASNPLGQMIFSPLFGYLANRFGSIRLVCMVTSLTYVAGNALYSILSVFPESARYGLLVLARFTIGVSSANAAPMRAYVSSATYQHERTFHMAILSAAQSLGLIVGPAFQAALTPIQCSEKVSDEDTWFAIDMYTASGWVSSVMGLVMFLLFSPLIFHEFDVAKEERKKALEKMKANMSVLPSPDNVVIVACIACFFTYYLNFVLIETLGSPLTMDQFGWTESEAVMYLGISMACGGLLSLGTFVSIGRLAQRFDERKLLIFCGIIPLIIGRFLFLPWPNSDSPEVAVPDDDNGTASADNFLSLLPHATIGARNIDCEDSTGGAPLCSHDWCDEQPGLSYAQFFIGFFINFLGYPFCVSISQAIFSKAIGPRPQGLWMGALTAAGSLARVLGPIMVSYVYNAFGLYLTFGIIIASMFVALAITLVMYKRMVPFKLPEGFDDVKEDKGSPELEAKTTAS